MSQANSSQIAMWRGAIALAWADGKLDDREKAKLIEYFNDNLYLSDAQRQQLIQDMNKNIRLQDVWPQITDKLDRAHLIDIAPTIFWQDGDYSPAEHEIYNKMFADHMSTLDIEKVKGEVKALAAQAKVHQKEVDKEYEEDLKAEGPIIGTAAILIDHFEKMIGI